MAKVYKPSPFKKGRHAGKFTAERATAADQNWIVLGHNSAARAPSTLVTAEEAIAWALARPDAWMQGGTRGMVADLSRLAAAYPECGW